ncbi:peptide methionine sulfoxide reductase [Flavobacterium zepuense]|uniref:peptide-methionine (S)-S-oxide reductase n=1 Tax=Flavobacterium zepuense TaxID=2593302 RepID=A0A552V619_9FLAO|nr:peptide-methionine (S)-S-oxide reductase [Flavobacterium zepuense]TRW25901.1 peptide methionine sulfoxide reductase [Flavobacterium zepuense]
MDTTIKKAGFGGGCHWCTEAVFASLKGVVSVAQGWIAGSGENDSFSEGVVIEYDTQTINLQTLIAVHLYTHSATSLHSMRGKYRSAIYTFNDEDIALGESAIAELQNNFEDAIITKVLPFSEFTLSKEEQLNYYYSDTQRPFCETYINPKLRVILKQFADVADDAKLQHLKSMRYI